MSFVSEGIPFDTAGSGRSGRLFCRVWRVGFQTPFVTRCRSLVSGCFPKDALDCGRRNAMAFGELPQALAALTISLDREVIQYQRSAAYVLTF